MSAASVSDLYDFDFEQAYPANIAALVQAGFNPSIGNPGGSVFKYTVMLDTPPGVVIVIP